jgi:hypothetical protein
MAYTSDSEFAAAIDRRGNVIDGTDHGGLRADTVNGGIIAGIETDHEIGVIGGLQLRQYVRQIRRTNFSGSAAGAGQPHQCLFFPEKHLLPFYR